MSKESILSCRGLYKSYKDGKLETPVLFGVDLDISAGEQVAILGASGSGKSTLLHILGGLEKPTQGEVSLLGNRFDKLSANKRAYLRNQHLGFIYQFHHLLPEFTALENVMMPLAIKNAPLGTVKKEAEKYLDLVNMSHRSKHYPTELSGGERQRIAIARALVNAPKCVLSDEPTGNLDEENASAIYKLMCQLTKELKTSFVVVTHDTRLANKLDRVCQMQHGKVVVSE
jgi:lipoprotein-releasing system ATP-binding protein